MNAKAPKMVNVTVEPGTSKKVEAFDADGNPVVFQIIADPCPDSPDNEEAKTHKSKSTVRSKMHKAP